MLALIATAAVFAAAPFPDYSETFTVKTVESNPTEGVIVRQTIIRDSTSVDTHRSMMQAEGTLVQGVLQQIVRCDIHPLGWFANIGGPNKSALQCTNMTRDPSPSSCQWSPFWTAPSAANVSSQDVVLNGTACTRWEWWDAGQQWAFWGTATTPLRSAKIFTPHAGWSVWAIDFHSFVAEPAPLHAFAALPGADCPPSSVPPASSSSSVGSVGPGGAGGHRGHGGALLATAGNGAMRWGKWEPGTPY